MLVERTPEDLSALILRAHHIPGMQENHSTFISRNPFGGYQGCALGMAYVAMVGDAEKAHFTYYMSVRIGYSPIHFFARELGIPPELALKVSNMHCAGDMPAAVIAQKILPWKVLQPETKVEPVSEAKTEPKKHSYFQTFVAWLRRSKPPQLRLVATT